MRGADCEGAEIIGVFANKDDAIKKIDEICADSSSWIRKSPEEARRCYEHNGRIHEGCSSVLVEEWEVNGDADGENE